MNRDPHSGPVPEQARHADALAREQGRVQVFNATRPDGLDGWTMDEQQYELMRAHILHMIDDHAAEDGTIALRDVVDAAQERYATHPLFPGGRTRNYCTYTKVDLEARCEIDRVPRSSPQRVRRHVPDRAGAPAAAGLVDGTEPDEGTGRYGGQRTSPAGTVPASSTASTAAVTHGVRG